MARQSATPDERRVRLRDKFWPEAANWIWDPSTKTTKGYSRVTRLLPLVLRLIRELKPKAGDPSMVYVDLWSRDFGQGIIPIEDPAAAAWSAGYDGARGKRTWDGHMKMLAELGFILAAKIGERPFARVLLLDPLAVCACYHEAGKVPPELWNAMQLLADEINADMPSGDKIKDAWALREQMLTATKAS